jgi:hypothetical protein
LTNEEHVLSKVPTLEIPCIECTSVISTVHAPPACSNLNYIIKASPYPLFNKESVSELNFFDNVCKVLPIEVNYHASEMDIEFTTGDVHWRIHNKFTVNINLICRHMS